MIFSSNTRTDTATKRERETDFEFLDRSSRPEIGRVRDFVAAALGRYPRHEVDELAARICARDDHAFRSATFELLLHDALVRVGYALQPHPALPNGTAARPDFLVTDEAGSSFYLEAVLASSKDGSNPAAEAIKATTIDALSQAPHKNFYIDVDSDGDPTSQPSCKALIRSIHEWLDAMNVDEVSNTVAEHGFEAAPSMTWEHESWKLTLRPIPVKPERRGGLRTLVGMQGGGAGIIDNWTPLRNALKKKGGKYGTLDKPFVVAVNANAFNLDPIDEMQALFGQEQYVEYVGRPDLGGHMRRIPNGAWMGPEGPQGRRVSGAWFFNDLNPYSIASRRCTLYANPAAHLVLPESMLRFPNAKVVDDRMVRQDGVRLASLFGLPEGWPERE